MTDKEIILAFIEERIKWNVDMLQRDPKPSDIGRIEEAKCIKCFINSLQEEPVSEDLEEEITKCYKSRNDLMMTRKQFGELIHRFTGWQKKQMLSEMPVSEDLEEAAKTYSNNLDSIYGSIGEQTRNAFKSGANWKRDQIAKENMLLPFKEYDNLMESINKRKKEGYEAGYKQGLVDSKRLNL